MHCPTRFGLRQTEWTCFLKPGVSYTYFNGLHTFPFKARLRDRGSFGTMACAPSQHSHKL